ncbi:MAG: nitrate/nitrite two-component system sensor histidine kinase [Moraxellaceae bacterium]|jgi:two-component system nitrate/nitrite sensor histidine kinase NarX|nr:nitrate/nitrite two-component system sensor histidine kinase [Moraxellaceae bacterium]
MLLRQLRSSLIAQASFVIGVLFLLALIRVFFVSGLNWLERHDDVAIDTTSALRSGLYQLTLEASASEALPAETVAIAALQRNLDSEALRLALERPGRDSLKAIHERLRQQWQQGLLPALEQGDNGRFLSEARPFVAELDALATGLQKEHARLQSLDLMQVIVTMLLVISLQLLAIYTLRRKVALPLQELVDATEKFRAGNLGIRVGYQAQDELGRLALSFNTMADALADSHRQLEEQVQNKVHRLAQANAALELLFRSSHTLAQSPSGAGALEELLRRFQPLLPGLHLALSLQSDPDQPAGHLVTLNGNSVADVHGEACNEAHQQVYAVRSQGKVLGELRARFSEARDLVEWEAALIQALADHIGSALMLSRQREHENRLLLLGERNTIARELHDSLAQSLSFMKLQIARLQALILQGEDCHAVEAVADELREGINDAYRQLRELLTTFRLDIGGVALADALQEAVQEFSRRGDVSIHLQAESLAVPLSAAEQIHLVQIMREALANCVRHAGASEARVVLRADGQEIELVVEDDGCGMTPQDDDWQHHGIAIMHERARSIAGTLHIESGQAGGTRLQLRFRPGFLSEQPRGHTP